MTVFKCGGSSLAKLSQSFASFVANWHRHEAIVLVHGGGPAITELEQKLHLKSSFNAKGQRITDETTLEVVVQCLAGTVNSQLVMLLAAAGIPSFGLSGCDGGLLRAKLKDYRELGWVGEITAVNSELLDMLCQRGFLPVVAPISMYDGLVAPPEVAISAKQLLNVNADDAAAAIAGELAAENMIFVSDIPGILNEKKQVLSQVSASEIEQLIQDGIIYGGMIAKVEAAIRLLQSSRTKRSALERVYIIDGTTELQDLNHADGDFRKVLDRGTCIYL